MKSTIIQSLECSVSQLPYEEQMAFIERLVHRLRGRRSKLASSERWESLYGAGKGLWDQDAQEYVDTLREKR
jgi:hypothetical protein